MRVLVPRIRRHQYDRELIQAVDILRATKHWAVHRDLLSRQRREELREQHLAIGRHSYYLVAEGDLPVRARVVRSPGTSWPFIGGPLGKENSNDA